MGQRLFEEVGRHLQTQGLKVSTGTIVDATIITAPSSTKNQNKARDPEMHQTKIREVNPACGNSTSACPTTRPLKRMPPRTLSTAPVRPSRSLKPPRNQGVVIPA